MDDPVQLLWPAAGLLFAIAAVAALAEHRRRRRRNLDRVGWVPWDLVQILAFMLALIAAGLALAL
jgi:uncharacterized membrane protein SpoIIM required for sporulation